MSWIEIGGPAASLLATPLHVYATSPSDGSLWEYSGSGNSWTRIGGPGAAFAYTVSISNTGPKVQPSLFSLAPDKQSVLKYSGTPLQWTKVGGSAGALYGGGAYLYATDPVSGDVHQMDPASGAWTQVGGSGSAFAQSTGADLNSTLYGLNSAGDVLMYNGKNGWSQIGGPATSLVGGGMNLYTTSRDGGNLMQYTPNGWQKVGGPFAMVATSLAISGQLHETLFGLAPDRSSVSAYSGTGDTWNTVGGPASAIAATGSTLYALNPDRSAILMLQQ